ncbi:MAG: hypothetical protein KatS3mg119_1890 [Rhodothalassiaceae bacterium]|nr:MAG: hypothetical protein KatS3mg119_1890 [Rhodothalassiaceae bacterium]
MPQMTPAEARVIDPVLTEIARGYRPEGHVGLQLAPEVRVGQRGGKMIQFGKEAFRIYDTARAPGTRIPELQLGYGANTYALVDHALQAKVPVEHLEEARAVPNVDLAARAVRVVQDIMFQRLEFDLATAVRDPTRYDSNHKQVLSGTSQWSDYSASTPTKDVRAWAEVIRSSIGRRPNTMVMGAAVFAALAEHPVILDRMKYTTRDSVTADILAQLFGIQKVLVGEAVYESGGQMVDMWGKDVILAYTIPASLADQGAPTFAYTYRLNDRPLVGGGWLDRDTNSWKYPVHDAFQPLVVGADAGFLAQNVVA